MVGFRAGLHVGSMSCPVPGYSHRNFGNASTTIMQLYSP